MTGVNGQRVTSCQGVCYLGVAGDISNVTGLKLSNHLAITNKCFIQGRVNGVAGAYPSLNALDGLPLCCRATNRDNPYTGTHFKRHI